MPVSHAISSKNPVRNATSSRASGSYKTADRFLSRRLYERMLGHGQAAPKYTTLRSKCYSVRHALCGPLLGLSPDETIDQVAGGESNSFRLRELWRSEQIIDGSPGSAHRNSSGTTARLSAPRHGRVAATGKCPSFGHAAKINFFDFRSVPSGG